MGNTFNSDRLKAMREAAFAGRHPAAAPASNSAPAAAVARSGCIQCAVYETEIARLKRDLASVTERNASVTASVTERNVVTGQSNKAMSNAERQRAYRQRKAQFGQS